MLSSRHSNREGTRSQLAKEGVDDGGIWSGVASLWEEMIEMSTYGPGERAMLKLKRKRRAEEQEADVEGSTVGLSEGRAVFDQDAGDDAEWLAAFTAAKESSSRDDSGKKIDYDGYKLNDLIISRWGVRKCPRYCLNSCVSSTSSSVLTRVIETIQRWMLISSV